MLIKLIAKNFKRHEELECDFSGGLTNITGPNYAGKSSMIDAINFALWGPQAVDGGMDVCLRKGAERLSVQLYFQVSGKSYSVKRTGSTCTLWQGDEVLSKSASACNNRIEELLGCNRKRFLQMKFAKQKQTEQMLTTGTTELHRIIEEVSGAGIVTHVLTKLTPLASECKGGLEALTYVNPEPLCANIKKFEKDLENISDTLVGLSLVLESNETDLQAAGKKVSDIHAHNHQAVSAQKQKAVLDDRYKACMLSITEAQQIMEVQIDTPEQLEVDQDRLNDLTENLSISANKLQQRKRLEPQLEKVQERLATDRAKLYELEALGLTPVRDSHISKLDAIAAGLSEDLGGISQQVKHINQLVNDSSCPTCHQKLGDQDPEKLKLQLEDLDQERIDKTKELAEINKKLNGLKIEDARFKAVDADKLQVISFITDREASVEELSDSLDDLGMVDVDQYRIDVEDRRELIAVVADLRKRAAAYTTAEDNISVRKNLLDQVNQKLAALGDVPESIDAAPAIKLNSEARVKVDSVNSEISKEKTTYATTDTQIKSVKQQLLRVEQDNEKIGNLKNQYARIDGLTKFLRTNRDKFVNEVWAGVLSYASNFASSCTGGDIQSVNRTDKGVFTYMENGEEFQIAAASGAQSSIMGLGIQLALDQMLPSEFGVIMLDEPTADMTPEVSLAACSMLKSLGNQVIMISHRELDSSVADQCIQL